MNRLQATNEEGRNILTVCSPLRLRHREMLGLGCSLPRVPSVGRQYCPFPRVLAITKHTYRETWVASSFERSNWLPSGKQTQNHLLYKDAPNEPAFLGILSGSFSTTSFKEPGRFLRALPPPRVRKASMRIPGSCSFATLEKRLSSRPGLGLRAPKNARGETT